MCLSNIMLRVHLIISFSNLNVFELMPRVESFVGTADKREGDHDDRNDTRHCFCSPWVVRVEP